MLVKAQQFVPLINYGHLKLVESFSFLSNEMKAAHSRAVGEEIQNTNNKVKFREDQKTVNGAYDKLKQRFLKKSTVTAFFTAVEYSTVCRIYHFLLFH